jgi:hypothetical protein
VIEGAQIWANWKWNNDLAAMPGLTPVVTGFLRWHKRAITIWGAAHHSVADCAKRWPGDNPPAKMDRKSKRNRESWLGFSFGNGGGKGASVAAISNPFASEMPGARMPDLLAQAEVRISTWQGLSPHLTRAMQ